MPTQREEGVECCYARQTKFWITDPDGALWEIYVFHEDIDDHGEAAPPRAEAVQIQTAPAVPARAWEHHLREPIPARIPHDDNTLHEVRLEGSFNAAPEAENRGALLAEAFRALRPEAAIHLHGLAGDCPCRRGHRAAGAGGGRTARAGCERRRRRACSRWLRRHQDREALGDRLLRRRWRSDARASNHRPQTGYRPRVQSHQAVYLGPMREVVDDFGTVLRRGVPTAMNIHDWQVLAKSTASSSFLFLKPGDAERARLLQRGRRDADRWGGCALKLEVSVLPAQRC